MKKTILSLIVMLSALCGHAQRENFDQNWRFCKEDVTAAQQAQYDDSKWEVLCLPHDWSIKCDYDKNTPAGHDGGYLPTGIGTYRKHFGMPKGAKHVRLHFEGVYMNAQVWVNGTLVAEHPYGYTPFSTSDIASLLHKGDNVVTVRVDNSKQKNSRWYSGSGIYRHVWMDLADDVHLSEWGVGITTPRVTKESATLQSNITVSNEGKDRQQVTVELTIDGLDGKTTQSVTVNPGDENTVSMLTQVRSPRLWSPKEPNLYNGTVCIRNAQGNALDSRRVQFGIRSIEYSAEKGFLLNGESIVMNGACVHHDNGGLGAAAPDLAEIHRARLLKEAGFNAIRTSHNPPSAGFLSACDSIGLLVIDESFDGWRAQKNPGDYHVEFDKWAVRDVQGMVLRDRNHPSIISWSIGNEIIERKSPQAVKDAHMLAEAIHQVDPTRPVTQALAAWDRDWEIYDPLAAEHEIVGYNYMIHKHKGDHERVPNRVMWQTESYPRDAFGNWAIVQDNPYVIGDYVWTGMDYIGESGIGRNYYEGETAGEPWTAVMWPHHGASCGDIDITGWRKPISHYRSILWGQSDEKMFLAVREPDGYIGKIHGTMWSAWPTYESWTWPGWEGKPIEVEVSSTYARVRLYKDGELVGELPTSRNERHQAVFKMPYQPGKLTAVGIDAEGRYMESQTLETAGEPAALRLTTDNSLMRANHEDVCFVVIEVVDAQGRLCPLASNELKVEVTGSATLRSVCNGNWQELDNMTNNHHPAWKGRAQTIVSNNGKPGKATVKVTSPGLQPAVITLQSK